MLGFALLMTAKSTHLLNVRSAAAKLDVRVSNAICIVPTDLAAFIAETRRAKLGSRQVEP